MPFLPKEKELQMDENLKKLLGLPNVEPVISIDDTEIKPEDIYLMDIPREAVEGGRLEPAIREFEKLSKRNFRSRVMLNFSGYDFDPREVYQIPEVRKWVNRLITNVPHLFYLISRENYAMRIVFLCIAPVAGRRGDQVDIDVSGAKRIIEKVTKSAVTFAKKAKEPEGVQFALANDIMDELGYDQL